MEAEMEVSLTGREIIQISDYHNRHLSRLKEEKSSTLAIMVQILQRILPLDAFSYIFSREIREVLAATSIQRFYRTRLSETCVCNYIDFNYECCEKRYYLKPDEDYLFCAHRCRIHRCGWRKDMHSGIKIWCIECGHHHCGKCGMRCDCYDDGGRWGIPQMDRYYDIIRHWHEPAYVGDFDRDYERNYDDIEYW